MSDRRTIIRIHSQRQEPLQQTSAVNGSVTKKRSARRRKSVLKPSNIALYVSVFVVIVSIIAAGYRVPQATTVASVGVAPTDASANQKTSVNEVVATTIAANVAEVTNLPVAANVANLSVSLAAKSEVATTNTTESVAKQQIVDPTSDRRSLITYVAKSGDTVDKVADEYGVSKQTIKWANDLTTDALDKNKKIVIPPVDGVIHVVEKGDTIEKLAKKYKASEERIVAFNDLELAGLKPGAKIIVPAGNLPEAERPGYQAPNSYATRSGSGYYGTFMSGSVGNRYVYGYCTWYAYERRASMGRPVGSFWGNAYSWAAAARSQGYTVSSTPVAGAIFQTSAGGGGYGHVGIIESVDKQSGTVTFSDMNGIAGWNRVGRNTISISQAQSQWVFIY